MGELNRPVESYDEPFPPCHRGLLKKYYEELNRAGLNRRTRNSDDEQKKRSFDIQFFRSNADTFNPSIFCDNLIIMIYERILPVLEMLFAIKGVKE